MAHILTTCSLQPHILRQCKLTEGAILQRVMMQDGVSYDLSFIRSRHHGEELSKIPSENDDFAAEGEIAHH